MSFIVDPSKQVQEVIFSRNTRKKHHLSLALNNNNVSETNSQKRLDVVLNNCLSYEDHLKLILNKVKKTIDLLRKLHNILPRLALLIIYKSFIRLHLDYGDIIHDQAYNASFQQKIELLKHNACLAITGAVRGTSTTLLVQKTIFLLQTLQQ